MDPVLITRISVWFFLPTVYSQNNFRRQYSSRMDVDNSLNLMNQLANVLKPRTKSIGTRGRTVTRYVSTGCLYVFLNEVLPAWSTDTTTNQSQTETEAARCLHMLKAALGIHKVIQSFGIDTHPVYSPEAFDQSPIVVQMLQASWRDGFTGDEVQQLNKIRTFVDLILRNCPNFYQLYDQKKEEYFRLVHALDTVSLKLWATHTDSETSE